MVEEQFIRKGISQDLLELGGWARIGWSWFVPPTFEGGKIRYGISQRPLLALGYSLERPNDTALIRVANRVFERLVGQKSNVESQVATALLVGEDKGAVLYAAAIELGETICTAAEPACMLCPIERYCSHVHS